MADRFLLLKPINRRDFRAPEVDFLFRCCPISPKNINGASRPAFDHSRIRVPSLRMEPLSLHVLLNTIRH